MKRLPVRRAAAPFVSTPYTMVSDRRGRSSSRDRACNLSPSPAPGEAIGHTHQVWQGPRILPALFARQGSRDGVSVIDESRSSAFAMYWGFTRASSWEMMGSCTASSTAREEAQGELICLAFNVNRPGEPMRARAARARREYAARRSHGGSAGRAGRTRFVLMNPTSLI
jgi:hypothetical protein